MAGVPDEENRPSENTITVNQSNSRLLVAKFNPRKINYIVKPVFIFPEE